MKTILYFLFGSPSLPQIEARVEKKRKQAFLHSISACR